MMKKIFGIRLLYRIAILSGIAILGIITWCVTSLGMGGRGMTGTLLFIIFLLILVACNTIIIASEETLWNEYCKAKKRYELARNNSVVKKNALFEYGYNRKRKYIMAIGLLTLTICFFFVAHSGFAKSKIMSALLTIEVFYLFLTVILTIWNRVDVIRLRKFSKEL